MQITHSSISICRWVPSGDVTLELVPGEGDRMDEGKYVGSRNPNKMEVLLMGFSSLLESGCIPRLAGGLLIPKSSVCRLDPSLLLDM